MTGHKPLVVLLGATATGKTGLALDIARALDGEIIGADSRQIYRYMDIGTAKPTIEQQAAIPHHLIDVVDPDEPMALADYQRGVHAAASAIYARGRLPLLVGGTGQYLTAVVDGWTIPEVPPNPALREELERFARLNGAQALHDRLRSVDPAAAEKIHPNNIRRTVRALEVSIESGQPISVLQRKQQPPYAVRQYGLRMERELLYTRADLRLEQMVADGFVDEVRRLLDMGYARTLPSLSALGYREIARHLLDGESLAAMLETTRVATHDFIRRQETWFSGHDSGTIWHNIDSNLSSAALTAQVLDDLQHWLKEQPFTCNT